MPNFISNLNALNMLSNSEMEQKDGAFFYFVTLFLLLLIVFSLSNFLSRHLQSYLGKELFLTWGGIKKLFLPCSYALYHEHDSKNELKAEEHCHLLSLRTEEAVLMLNKRLYKKNNIVLNLSRLPQFPVSDYRVKATVISCHNVRGDYEHYETRVKFLTDLKQESRKPILKEYLTLLAGPSEF